MNTLITLIAGIIIGATLVATIFYNKLSAHNSIIADKSTVIDLLKKELKKSSKKKSYDRRYNKKYSKRKQETVKTDG